MAESLSASTSKAAQKNKKRNKKGAASNSSHGGNEIDFQDILLKLKDQLEEAKSNKDHQQAGKLRDQIWVLTDVIRGVKTNLPEDELEEIINSLPLPSQPSKAASEPASTGNSLSTTERRVKSLQKKLKQIEDLKEKQTKGAVLEANQLDKIKSEETIREEIKELTEIMNSVL